MSIAWYTAAFERQQKLPSLRSVLWNAAGAVQVKASTQQMKTMLGIVAGAYGIPLKRIEH